LCAAGENNVLEIAMDTVIAQRIRVDANHGIRIMDMRLTPGTEVEVIVRSPTPKTNKSFLQTALAMNLDLPADYSVAYEQQLQKH
jgi:hypothetical protein